jgi:hypothetical protein
MATNTLKGAIADIRNFMYGGMRTLPLTLAGTMLVLGLMSANYSMLFFLIGLFLIPVLSMGFNNVMEWLLSYTRFADTFKITPSDICNVVIPYKTMTANSSSPVKTQTVITSTWMALISFFFGYLITNASSLLAMNNSSSNIQIDITSDEDTNILPQQSTRLAQAGTSLVLILIALVFVLVFRYTTSCETITGMLISLVLFGGLGASWYRILALPGEQRLSDLFGIANRILPSSAMLNGPMACLPVLLQESQK